MQPSEPPGLSSHSVSQNHLNSASIHSSREADRVTGKPAPQLSFKQGQSLYLSCRSWLKSGLGWHWLPSWEAEASVVRLRAGGSTAAALLNWDVKLFTE